MAAESRPGLERRLGATDLTFLFVGGVIGSGIFLVPSTILRQVGGSASLAMLVWVAGGVLALLGAVTYGHLSAANPATGGLYVYLKDAYGPMVGFLFGWTVLFVIGSGATAALAVAFSGHVATVVPLAHWQRTAVAIGLIVLISAVNSRSARGAATVQNWTTAAKVVAIVVLSLALILLAGAQRSWASLTASADMHVDVSAVGTAMISVLWAYDGWQFSTFAAGETANAKRAFPTAFVIGALLTTGVYLLANVGYLAALGPVEAARTDTPAAAAAQAVAGPAAHAVVAVLVLLSIFSAANGIKLTAPRVYYAMARDGMLWSALGRVHPKFRTPAMAIHASAVASILLAVTGSFGQLLTYVVFSGCIFYAAAAATMFRSPARTAGRMVAAGAFILALGFLAVNTVVKQPRDAGVGLALVLLGLVPYAIVRRAARRSASPIASTGPDNRAG